MKNDKGITLISLIVYLILMTFVVVAISSITTTFYTNIKEFDDESESAVAYSKFNMYFLRDIKREGVEIQKANNDYVIISYVDQTQNSQDGNNNITVSTEEKIYVQYSVQNDILYRDKVKICENVKDVKMTADSENQTIEIYLKIGDYEKTTTYVIETFQTVNN